MLSRAKRSVQPTTDRSIYRVAKVMLVMLTFSVGMIAMGAGGVAAADQTPVIDDSVPTDDSVTAHEDDVLTVSVEDGSEFALSTEDEDSGLEIEPEEEDSTEYEVTVNGPGTLVFEETGTEGDEFATVDVEMSSVPDPQASDDGYTDFLESLYEIAHITLQYAGFIAVFAGAVLWFTARRSSSRASTGVWLLLGGLLMVMFHYAFDWFVSLIRWVAEGGAG